MNILEKYNQNQTQSTSLYVPKKNQVQILEKIKDLYQENLMMLKKMLGQ